MNKKAFTLIEIMIVVIIIAALASMIVPRLSGRSEEARASIAQGDISANISLALKLYELDNGNYPTSEQGLQALLSKPTSSPVPMNWNGPYLEKKAIDPWGKEYQYTYPGTHNPQGFDLYSMGKDGVESDDDVTNWQ